MLVFRHICRCHGARAAAAALLATCLLAGQPLRASERYSPAPADARPLTALLERVRADFGDAKVLKVELEPAQSRGERAFVYEIKLFTPHGAVIKAVYDARTLERLTVKGRHGGHRDSDD